MDTNKIKYCSISVTKLLKLKYCTPLSNDGRVIKLGGGLDLNPIIYGADYSAFFDPNWKQRKLVDKSNYAGVSY